MGCGKARPVQAAASVDEPEWPQKTYEKRARGSEQPLQPAAQTAYPKLLSSDSKLEQAAQNSSGPRAASLVSDVYPAAPTVDSRPSDGDTMLRPPQPPLPPSLTGSSAATASIGGDGALRSAGRPLGDVPRGSSIPGCLPSKEEASRLRTTAAADTSQDTGSLPGTICTTPRGQRRHEDIPRQPMPIENSGDVDFKDAGKPATGKSHVGKAFLALGSSDTVDTLSSENFDIDSALAMLGGDDNQDRPTSGSPTKWPLDIHISASSRVMVLTWARWSRNSLRIKAEQRLKLLQHVRYPKIREPLRTPPLSPQPTPRGDDNCSGGQANGQGQEVHSMPSTGISALPSRVGGKRHPATASRGRNVHGTQANEGGRLLFDVMADERREAQEAQAVKMKLKHIASIEDAHTDSDKTPGFGVDTPGFGSGGNTLSRKSPMDSVVSSGVASPMAGGQMSPWLLEAEALVNADDEDSVADVQASMPAPNAWGFAPSQLYNVPEVDHTLEELDEIIGDDDELEQVGFYIGQCMPQSPSAREADGQQHSPDQLSGTDSLASTATSPSVSMNRSSRKEKEMPPSPNSKSGTRTSHSRKSSGEAMSHDMSGEVKHSELSTSTKGESSSEYAVGEKVSYWSASRGVWLPAVVVERKPSNVYVIDKQMKCCLAKVRASEIISAAEEQKDPVLRALAAFETPKTSSCSGTPQGSGWQPPGNEGSSPRGSGWQPPGIQGGSPRSSGWRPTSEEAGTPRGGGDASAPRGSGWRPPSSSPRRASGNASRHTVKQGATNAASECGTPCRKAERMKPSHKAPVIQAALPPALAGVAVSTSRSPRRGKIVRDDFSDDSDDD